MRPIFMFVAAVVLWGVIGYAAWIVWQISFYAGVNGF